MSDKCILCSYIILTYLTMTYLLSRVNLFLISSFRLYCLFYFFYWICHFLTLTFYKIYVYIVHPIKSVDTSLSFSCSSRSLPYISIKYFWDLVCWPFLWNVNNDWFLCLFRVKRKEKAVIYGYNILYVECTWGNQCTWVNQSTWGNQCVWGNQCT